MDHLSNLSGMLCTKSVNSPLFKLANTDSNVMGETSDDPGCISVSFFSLDGLYWV